MQGLPPDFTTEAFIAGYQSRTKRVLFSIASWVWGRHWSPGIAFKIPGYYGALMLHKGWMQRIKNTDPVIRSCFSRLLMESALRKQSIETCLDVILAFGGYAHRPLNTLFREKEQL